MTAAEPRSKRCELDRCEGIHEESVRVADERTASEMQELAARLMKSRYGQRVTLLRERRRQPGSVPGSTGLVRIVNAARSA